MKVSEAKKTIKNLKNNLVLLEAKTTAPFYIHFGYKTKIKEVVDVSKTNEEEGLHVYGLDELDQDENIWYSSGIVYVKSGYAFELEICDLNSDLEKVLKKIDKLF